MKNKARIAGAALLVLASTLLAAPAAQAHYDPWNTHWHYSNGVPTYLTCGWWDTVWGCKTVWANGTPVVRY